MALDRGQVDGRGHERQVGHDIADDADRGRGMGEVRASGDLPDGVHDDHPDLPQRQTQQDRRRRHPQAPRRRGWLIDPAWTAGRGRAA